MSALEIYPVAEILVAWGGLRRCLIVTALETELLAVQAHLSEVKSAVGDNGTIYECGLFSTGAEDWLIVLPTGDMGKVASTEVVEIR